MSSWINHAIFWHVYPLGFLGAEPQALPQGSVFHRLAHLVEWLEYAVELGASGLLLGPIFASSTHGYDTIDHFQIDPRLGDEADFDRLVTEARRRGLHIVLDGVFNHVGRNFRLFSAARRKGTGSAEAGWFRWLGHEEQTGEPAYATFEGHHQLVALNHESPHVAAHVSSVMNHWLSRGASGWRLDAAYAVPRQFWARVLPQVRKCHPDAYIFGEVIHGDYCGFVADTGIDAVTQYELWKAIWSALNDRNLFELNWALERHNGFLDSFVPLTFIGNHDVTRLASKLDDERHVAHALVILMTVGGTPSIYAGDEQAFRGIKENRAGGDDAVRPAFPSTPGKLAANGWSTYRLHQQLIGLRRRHPWLVQARSRRIHLKNREMVMALESEGNSLLVAFNLDDREAILPAPQACGVLAGAASLSHAAGSDATTLRLAGNGWAVLSSLTTQGGGI
ncbi:cyclomaltodextrinase [Neorhizobium galegae]|uniref:alpha-amylase family protein n=1 Tax=Neorhizobium galegae TaxID=399 RepID=UPI00277E55C4|nr:alpha-amylase family protein [Neorhizobium galegae]MDQ0138252.1 cyclomaltodextrinase [Neorhizobium galegae]